MDTCTACTCNTDNCNAQLTCSRAYPYLRQFTIPSLSLPLHGCRNYSLVANHLLFILPVSSKLMTLRSKKAHHRLKEKEKKIFQI